MKTDKPKKTYAVALLFALTVAVFLLALRGLVPTEPLMPPEAAARAGDTDKRALNPAIRRVETTASVGAKVETVDKPQAGEPAMPLNKIPQ